MANIALISLDLSHSAPVATKALLESLGHSVTGITSAAATASSLVAYDLICWCRGSDNATHITEVVGAFNQGVPIISGYVGGVSSAYHLPVQALGFTNQANIAVVSSDSAQTSFIIKSDHEIITGFGSVGDTVQVYNSASFMVALTAANLSPNALQIGQRVGDSTRISMMIVNKGELNLAGVPAAASFAHFDWIYGSAGYTATAKEILNRTINQFVLPKKIISGSIIDIDGNAAVRKIYAVNLATNLVEKTINSDVDGTYSLELIDGVDYAIFCIDTTAAPLIYVG